MVANVREEAKRLIESLPDDVSWKDLMQLMLDRAAIEAGIQDCNKGRVISLEEFRKGFEISE